jgi:hypothetical protein
LQRRPKGYLGNGHETIGSDILAVLRVTSMPKQILGTELAARLAAVQPESWYPIQLLLDVLETLGTRVGPRGLVQMGRQLFQLSHAERVKAVAKSAGDIICGIDDMYHHANRGSGIGGWEVKSFAPGKAVLVKTTPHHCALEEGILEEALTTVGVPAFLDQIECFRKGAEACQFAISSVVTDARWMGRWPERR